MKKVETLKNQLNRLERQVSENRDAKALELAIERLNRLTDSIIMRSKQAWAMYSRLEHECEQSAVHPVQLNDLKAMCKKTEQLAADLLCYSLARFKQNDT